MGGRDVLIEKIKNFIQNYLQVDKNNKKRKYVLAVALIAILLIVVGNLLSPKNDFEGGMNQ